MVASRSPLAEEGDLTLQEQVERLEKNRIAEALRNNDHNRTHTAKALGLSRQGLLKKMERYGLG